LEKNVFVLPEIKKNGIRKNEKPKWNRLNVDSVLEEFLSPWIARIINMSGD
jgi:hypothetical protein